MANIRGEILTCGGSVNGMKALVAKYGRDAVESELDDMTTCDLADNAFTGAVNIGAIGIARYAAEVLVNSGGYSDDVKLRAKRFLGR